MANFLIQIDDELLEFAAKRLGSATYEETMQTALQVAAGLTDRTQVSELRDSEEDAADVAAADAAIDAPGDSIPLAQIEDELVCQ